MVLSWVCCFESSVPPFGSWTRKQSLKHFGESQKQICYQCWLWIVFERPRISRRAEDGIGCLPRLRAATEYAAGDLVLASVSRVRSPAVVSFAVSVARLVRAVVVDGVFESLLSFLL